MTTAAPPESSTLAGPPRNPRQRAESLLKQMEQARDRHLPRWRDLEAYIAPYSSDVDRRGSSKRTGVAVEVLDESIFYARLTFKAFLASSMTNPSRTWSEWMFPNPELRESQAAKEYLYELNHRRMVLLSQSNFYESMSWVYGEWPTFGTAVVLIEEDEQDLFRYVPWEIGSYAIADDAKGNPIALSRRFPMTVRQIVERFATRADGSVDTSVLSRQTVQLVEGQRWEQEIEVAHVICPNDAAKPGSRNPKAMPFASYYWEWGRTDMDGPSQFLAHEGYHEWPAMVFRWARMGSDPWGTDSPGYLTLGAVKSAQAMESDLMLAIEKQVRPPLAVPTGMVNVSLLPAAINKVDMRAGQQYGALHDTHPTAIQQARESLDRVTERIYSLWYTRLILSTNARDTMARGGSTQPRTAREIEEISAEKFQILGPVVEAAASAFRVGSDREFGIMQRRGVLPSTPPDLEGEPLSIEYTSALAIAQRSVGLSNLMEYGFSAANIAKLVGDPSITLRTNWSEWMQEVGNRSGLPPKVQRTDEEVERLQRAEEEAVAQQARAEQLALEAKATRDLGTTPMGEDTALDRTIAAAGATPGGGL